MELMGSSLRSMVSTGTKVESVEISAATPTTTQLWGMGRTEASGRFTKKVSSSRATSTGWSSLGSDAHS